MKGKEFTDPEREYLESLVRDRAAANAEVARAQRALDLYAACLRKQHNPPRAAQIAEDLSGWVRPPKPKPKPKPEPEPEPEEETSKKKRT